VFGLNEDPAVYTAFWTELWPQVDERFVDWLKARFLGLINLPPSPPILVHHINRHLLRPVQEGGKVALLVLDGLSIAAWNVLRDHLSTVASAPYRYTESAVMAWTPSLTPVSRQAIFAGKAPTYFPETVFRTDRDGARWKEFWQSEAKLTDSQIEHVGFKGDVEECQPFEDDLRPEVRALGMTVFKTDQIMHGVNLGWPAMLGELSIWLAEGFLSRLLASLVARNFRVYVTSDHGNIEALGCGAISEGVLAERRGERTRIYTTPELRNKAAVTHAALGLEQGIDHLSGLYALMPLRRGAFVTKREKLVSHGGMSLDEMFVPFVEVTKL
jgi:hypothetical protein